MESYTKPTVTSPFIFKEPPIISYNKGKFLKDMLVREKLLKVYTRIHTSTDVQPVNPCILSLCLFGFAMSFLVLPWGFWFCRELFGFAESFWFCLEIFGFAVRTWARRALASPSSPLGHTTLISPSSIHVQRHTALALVLVTFWEKTAYQQTNGSQTRLPVQDWTKDNVARVGAEPRETQPVCNVRVGSFRRLPEKPINRYLQPM